MALGADSISAIIGGVSNVTGSLLNFGAGVYAVNHTQLPAPDEYNYNIVLPQQEQSSVITPGLVALVAVMLIVLIIGLVVAFKIT